MIAGSLSMHPATPAEQPALRQAVVALQEFGRRLHRARLPGEQIADDHLARIWRRAASGGALLIAEMDGVLAGFVAGRVAQAHSIAETPDSNRFGLISDICVMSDFRGHRLATRLIGEIECRLRRAGVVRLRVTGLAANASARPSYQHAGFRPYEIVYETLIGGGDDE